LVPEEKPLTTLTPATAVPTDTAVTPTTANANNSSEPEVAGTPAAAHEFLRRFTTKSYKNNKIPQILNIC
jgi:hypothetical protein